MSVTGGRNLRDSWVDEIYVISLTTCRDPEHCGGPESYVHCAEFPTRAQAFDVQFCKDIQVLGFETNHKDVTPMLSAVFLSTGFDTRTMECCVARKSRCIPALVSDILRTLIPTRREVAALLNKLMWSEPAFFNVLLLTWALQGLIHGIEHRWQWDERLTIKALVVSWQIGV